MTGAGTLSLPKSLNFDLRRVTPEQIPASWPEIERMLNEQPGLWNQLWTLESIEQQLSTGGFQLWVVRLDDSHDLFTMSVVINFPACRILRFWLANGRGVDEYMWAVVEEMNKVAHELGCTHMEMEIGRKGWEVLMRPHGVKLSRQILRKEVTESRRQ